MPTPDELLLDQIEGQAPASDDEALLNEIESKNPAFTPASSAEAAASTTEISEMLRSVQKLEPVAPNVSVIDDFRPKIQTAAKGALSAAKLAKIAHAKIGYGQEDLNELFRSDDILAHAASAGLGDVWSVAKDERSKRDWYDTARKRADQFMAAKGYKEIATPQEAAEIQSAFLFGELAWRVPMHPDTLAASSAHGLKTLLEQRRQVAADQGAVTTEFSNAAAFLSDLAPDEVIQLRGYAASLANRTPQNEQEALLMQAHPGGSWPYGWADLGPGGTQKYRFPARSYDALRVVLGTSNPSNNLLNHLEQTDLAFKAKDLGLIKGDLTRPGVEIPDPRAPGGFLDVDLVPPDTLAGIERRKNASGIASPFDVKASPQEVIELKRASGLDTEQATQIVENATAVEGARQAQAAGFGMKDERKVGSETFTATEWNALSLTQKTLQRLVQAFGPEVENVVRPFSAWREAQRQGVGEAIAHRVVYTMSGDEDLAQQANSLSDIVSIAWGLISQYDALETANIKQTTAVGARESAPDLALPARVAGLSSSYSELDPSLEVKLFRGATSAVQQWANSKTRDSSRQDEEGRRARMSTAERIGYTDKYGRVDYAADLMASGFHNTYEGLGAAAAQVIDNPEYIPLLVGANAIGDRVAGIAFSSMRRGIEGALASQAASAAMKQVLRHAPHEVGTLRRIANERLAEAAKLGSQEAAIKAVKDLEAQATQLQKEWESVRAGGDTPSGESIDRVAGLWKQASDVGVDFEELTDMVQRMQPRGLTATGITALRNKFGLPQYLNENGLRGLSHSYQNLANRLQTSLGREATDVLEATDLEKRIAESKDPAEQGALSAKLAALQGGHARPLGLTKRLELYSEIEGMIDDVRGGRGADNARFQEVRTQLWGEPDMTDLDFAALVQIDETKRYAPDGPVGKLMAKILGYAPEQLDRIKKAGKRILDFAAQDAQDLYLTKFGAGVRNMRTNKAYLYAKTKVRQAVDELERSYVGKIRDEDYESGAQFLKERLTQLDNEHRRATTNPVDSPWDADESKILLQTIGDYDLAMIAEGEPLLFGGVQRGDFVSQNPTTGVDEISGTQLAELRRLYSTPSLRQSLSQTKRLAVGEQFVELHKAMRNLNSRRRRLEKAMARSNDPDLIQEKLDEVYEQLEEKGGEYSALKMEIKLNAKRAWRDIGEVEKDASSEVAVKIIGAEIDVLGGSGMPFWGISRAVHELPRTTARRQAAWFLRIGDLYSELDNLRSTLDPKVSKQLDSLMRSGHFTGSAADYPKFKAVWDAVYPSGDDTKWSNVQRFLQTSEKFRVNMLEDMRAMGRIDEPLYKKLVEQGYDKHQYGIYEASKAINDAEVQSIRRALKDRTATGSQIGMGGEALLFQRDLFKHRVRVREADGFIREAKFPNEAQARDWVRRQYGSEAAASIKSTEQSGFMEGKTPSGDRIVLADPIGSEGIEVLGLSTKTPEVLLKSFEDVVRDNHMYLLLNSLRSSGLVVSKLEHTTLFNQFGDSSKDFAKQFRRLPNDRRRLGDLSGYYVHKKLLSELNNYSHSFEQFRAWTDSLSEVFQAAGASVPEELINKSPHKFNKYFFRPMTRIVKNAVILWNAPTWASNVLFNVTLSHLVDGKIFSAANTDNWKLAFREIWGDPRGRTQRSQLYMDFVADGLSSGRPFEADIHSPSVRAALRALEFDNPKAVAANLSKYERLSRQYEEDLKLDRDPKHLESVKLQIVVLQTVLDEYEKKLGQRLVQRIGGFFLNNRNLLGLPNSRVMQVLKAGYGNIDETFKFVNYANLRKKGMPRADAKWEIEQHFQDYSKVPYAIGAMASNPMGALVPSFPWELMRITKNLLKNKPLKTLALMSLVPALNTVSAAAAGVDDDRLDAVLHQAGHRNRWERFKSKFTELRLWDPQTKEPVASVSLLNLVPFMQMTEGRGFLAQAGEYWFPEEDRSVGTGLLAEGMSAVANFIGNNPLTNGIGVGIFNRDPLTGQQVLDARGARPADYLKAGWRHLGRQFLPRAGLLLTEDLPRSLRAPVDPVSGRPFGVPHWTEVLSAQVGVRIKGLSSMFHRRADVQGRKLGNDEALVKSAMYGVMEKKDAGWLGNPQYGPDQDLRWYTTALADPRTGPEERVEYEKAIKDLLSKDREISVLGRKHRISSTERQEWLAAERLEQKGVPTLYTQATPEEQSLILSWVDRGGARSETIGELISLATRSQNTGQVLGEKDAESIQKALAVLKQRLSEPGADGRLQALVQHWTAIQHRAAGLYRAERGRKAGRR